MLVHSRCLIECLVTITGAVLLSYSHLSRINSMKTYVVNSNYNGQETLSSFDGRTIEPYTSRDPSY